MNNEESAADAPKNAEENFSQSPEPKRNVFEIPEDARFFSANSASVGEADLQEVPPQHNFTSAVAESNAAANAAENAEHAIAAPEPTAGSDSAHDAERPTVFQNSYNGGESQADTIRQSGLAYSAAIVLVGAVVFMLILGWFADLLLGTSPWGIVIGIVIGAIIGFVQFFRITSSIFKK